MAPSPHDIVTIGRSIAGAKSTVPWTDLVNEYFRRNRHATDVPGAHDALWKAASEAAIAGLIKLPADKGDGWTGVGRYRRPDFIKLPRERKEAFVDSHAWHPELMPFAPGERPGERRDVLLQVDHWLKTQRATAIQAPPKERSLEITGDEKRLVSSSHGFFGGKLPLSALRCRLAPLPIPTDLGADPAGKPILLVENADSFDSFARWNETSQALAAVAYGAGGNERAIAYDDGYLDQILRRHGASKILYLGDIDPRGFDIPAGANQRRLALGLAPIEPAVGLYEWLLDHGLPAPGADARGLSYLAADWIGHLRPRIAELFNARRRIAQEWLGAQALARHGDRIAKAL